MEIRHAVVSELDKVCEILACEFYSDPVLGVAFTEADRERRIAALRFFFCAYVNLSVIYGGVLLAAEGAGVLVYFRPELREMTGEESAWLNKQLRLACVQDHTAVTTLMNGLENHHPTAVPHYYVFAIAVRASHRRRGIAAEMLRELNRTLDDRASPCYAECTTLGSRELFLRAGFQAEPRHVVIKGFPLLFPVWRDLR
jgi:ribosomal protein S18 acetylase RimI-like enzyme